MSFDNIKRCDLKHEVVTIHNDEILSTINAKDTCLMQ